MSVRYMFVQVWYGSVSVGSISDILWHDDDEYLLGLPDAFVTKTVSFFAISRDDNSNRETF